MKPSTSSFLRYSQSCQVLHEIEQFLAMRISAYKGRRGSREDALDQTARHFNLTTRTIERRLSILRKHSSRFQQLNAIVDTPSFDGKAFMRLFDVELTPREREIREEYYNTFHVLEKDVNWEMRPHQLEEFKKTGRQVTQETIRDIACRIIRISSETPLTFKQLAAIFEKPGGLEKYFETANQPLKRDIQDFFDSLAR